MNKVIEELKAKLMTHGGLIESESASQGLPTGLSTLDQQLPWGGLPRGAITAFVGPWGSGRTRVWAATLQNTNKWGAWVGPLLPYPPGLSQYQLHLGRLLCVRPQADKTLWSLQQLAGARFFSLIGCEWAPELLTGASRRSISSDLQKITEICRTTGTTIVMFLERWHEFLPHWHFKMRLHFEHSEFLRLEKAQGCNTPLLVRRPSLQSLATYEKDFGPALIRHEEFA